MGFTIGSTVYVEAHALPSAMRPADYLVNDRLECVVVDVKGELLTVSRAGTLAAVGTNWVHAP